MDSVTQKVRLERWIECSTRCRGGPVFMQPFHQALWVSTTLTSVGQWAGSVCEQVGGGPGRGFESARMSSNPHECKSAPLFEMCSPTSQQWNASNIVYDYPNSHTIRDFKDNGVVVSTTPTYCTKIAAFPKHQAALTSSWFSSTFSTQV